MVALVLGLCYVATAVELKNDIIDKALNDATFAKRGLQDAAPAPAVVPPGNNSPVEPQLAYLLQRFDPNDLLSRPYAYFDAVQYLANSDDPDDKRRLERIKARMDGYFWDLLDFNKVVLNTIKPEIRSVPHGPHKLKHWYDLIDKEHKGHILFNELVDEVAGHFHSHNVASFFDCFKDLRCVGAFFILLGLFVYGCLFIKKCVYAGCRFGAWTAVEYAAFIFVATGMWIITVFFFQKAYNSFEHEKMIVRAITDDMLMQVFQDRRTRGGGQAIFDLVVTLAKMDNQS